jgi:hypothetical protein
VVPEARLVLLLVTRLLSPLLVVMFYWLVDRALQVALFSSVAVWLLAKMASMAMFRSLATM